MVRDFDLEGTNKSEEVEIAQLDYLYKSMKNCDQDPALAKKWAENNKVINEIEDKLKM